MAMAMAISSIGQPTKPQTKKAGKAGLFLQSGSAPINQPALRSRRCPC
ncbi:hypothetical protein LG3211_3408 [Lysobacter gummosus]|nr:hypothetical protein LG3211_3408 [Lysobacter gummosus]